MIMIDVLNNDFIVPNCYCIALNLIHYNIIQSTTQVFWLFGLIRNFQ